MNFLAGLPLRFKFKREDGEESEESVLKRRRFKIILAGTAVLTLAVLGFAAWAFSFFEEIYWERRDRRSFISNVDRALFLAVRNGGVEDVIRSLNEGADVHAFGESGVTPFRAAIALGRTDVVRKFIEAGRGGAYDELYPLFVYAIAQNSPQIVKELVKLLPDVNSLDRNGLTPLLYAIDRGYIEVARELLNAGADVNARSRDGISPLIAAVMRGRHNMVTELLQAGADCSVLSPSGDVC